MLLTSTHRVARVLHLALGLLIAVGGGINLALCIANDRGLQLIVFHAAELAGALLFMLPRTLLVGACILVCAYLAAAGIHALDRTLPFEHLIYAMAVMFAVIQYRAPITVERPAA